MVATTNKALTRLRKKIQQLELARRQKLEREFRWAAKAAYKPRIRSRVEFAEQCIVIPEGPFEGFRWRREYQPYAHQLLELMDTLGYRRFAVTGCVQSGKTFNAVVINLCWHLFERKQSVIFLVPELHMAEKKWKEEIEPVIMKSRHLRQFMPIKGAGSHGGFGNVIRFANGTRLEFMGATGSDARRSSSTAPVIFKTEVDRTDTASEGSREAAPAVTVEDRAAAYGDSAWIYEECTMTTEDGRINTEFKAGTATEPHSQCPHCFQYVLPKREHLVGIEDCKTVVEARESGCFICPSCQEILSDEDRHAMQANIVPVSRGQTVRTAEDGSAIVEGPMPATETFSYRWNAFHNRFWSTPLLSAKEWNALYADSQDDEDKQSRQKRWAEPAKPEQFDVTRLTMKDLIDRTSQDNLRTIPDGTTWVTSALDVGKHYLHYAGRSWCLDGDKITGHLHDVGRMPVDSDRLGVDDAVLTALRSYRDNVILAGYYDKDGNRYRPGWTLIDAGWKERLVWKFVLECVQMGIFNIAPIIGRGQSEPNNPGSYRHPEKADGKKVVWIGDECHMRVSSRHAEVFAQAGCPHPPLYVVVNADETKSYVRDGYQAPIGTNGSLTVGSPVTAEDRELLTQFRKETLAETEYRKYIDGRGSVSFWRNVSRRKNHYGDADYYNVPAAQLCGAPVTVRNRVRVAIEKPTGEHLTMPDGRRFMDV